MLQARRGSAVLQGRAPGEGNEEKGRGSEGEEAVVDAHQRRWRQHRRPQREEPASREKLNGDP